MEEEEKQTEEKQSEEKKNIITWLKEHPRFVFWVRLVLWFGFACVLPFSFIAWRYGIFSSDSRISLTGWGVIGIIIVIVFVIKLIKYAYQGMKPGLVKQCITGFVSIILPLLVLLLLVRSIKNSVSYFEQALNCVIICEAIGIPINPFPTWLEKRRIEQGKERAETLTEVVINKIRSMKKDGKE